MTDRIARLVCRLLGHDWLLTAQGPGRGGVWHRAEECGRCGDRHTDNFFPYNAERFRRDAPAYSVDPQMPIVCPLCGAETAQSAHHTCPEKNP